jgi:hypothetical protein
MLGIVLTPLMPLGVTVMGLLQAAIGAGLLTRPTPVAASAQPTGAAPLDRAALTATPRGGLPRSPRTRPISHRQPARRGPRPSTAASTTATLRARATDARRARMPRGWAFRHLRLARGAGVAAGADKPPASDDAQKSGQARRALPHRGQTQERDGDVVALPRSTNSDRLAPVRARNRSDGPPTVRLGQRGLAEAPFVGDAAASSRRVAATSPVPLHFAQRSFASLSDDPYPLQRGHHM